MEESLVLGCGGQEVFVLIGQTEERVASREIFLGELDHAIALIFELSVDIGDILDIDLFGRGEGVSSVDEGIRIGYEVFEFFLALEGIYFAIEKGNILVVFDADLDIFSSYLVADRTEIQILRDIMQDTVGT